MRAIKNRFGSTNEAGVFEMRQGGLVEVLDASARFVAEATRAPGSVVLAAMEGSRPLLVEVQALVSPSELVPPRRVVNGLDRNRLALVLAVLARHGGLAARRLPTSSSTSSAACGSTSRAPTSPSRWRSRAPSRGVDARTGRRADAAGGFGELGLTGELRWVGHPERRIAEARKFGLDPVIAPPGARRAASSPTLRAALARAHCAAPR